MNDSETPKLKDHWHRLRLRLWTVFNTLGLSRAVRSKVKYWFKLSGIVIPLVLVVFFVTLWFIRRDRVPRDVPVATALNGSSYHVFGTNFCEILSRHLKWHHVRVVKTRGSGSNVQMLRDGTAQLGMYQGGTIPLEGQEPELVVIAPLYREVVHVLVKKRILDGAAYEGREPSGDMLCDLLVSEGREVYAGSADSGMRCSAHQILEHYGIERQQVHFAEKESRSTDVVISTTGMFSKAMQNRLQTGEYQYLSIDAEAIARRHAHFTTYTLPKASYRSENGQPVPDEDISTVAATAFLIAPKEASARLVSATLDALYQGDLGRRCPDLIPRKEAGAYQHGMAVHKCAGEFFYPYDISYLVGVIESMAATKELFVALCAGIYLLWTLRRRREERLRHAEVEANRVRLDWFVDRTVAIESRQINATDPTQLTKYLEEVTRIKLEALDELTDAELRGDRLFSIFLLQCANLSQNLQLKIIAHTTASG